MNILEKIIGSTKIRIEAQKRIKPPDEIKAEALSVAGSAPSFNAALRSDGVALICEIKRASPSKGIIAENFPYLEIAREYEAAGANAISVLTEPEFFKGDNRYLQEISKAVSIPVLRKDFVIDEYMVYEAKALGASAVLLICAALDDGELSGFISLAHSLGMSALAEARNESEVKRALDAGAGIVGVNNRDLKTFEVDMSVSERLRKLVPPKVLFVSESGIKTPEDIRRLREIGADAVLIGETIMRSADKRGAILRLRGERL